MNKNRDPRTQTNFRAQLLAGQMLAGTFIKLPVAQSVEIIGEVGFDFVVIDAEHAPFHRGTIDTALLAARASGISGLVRVPDANPSEILSALDCGADGVLVPHVDSAEKARSVARACRYRKGSRGFTAAGRAGRYGDVATWEHVDKQDSSIAVIAMIEDVQGLEEMEQIAAVDGIDGFFIGRGDLAVVLGASSARAIEVASAVERIASIGRAAGKAICIMADGAEEASAFRALGVTAFLLDSDQAFLRKSAMSALDAIGLLR